MSDHRLGFLIPSSIIAGILTLLLTAGLWLTRGGLLFSPGPLSSQSGQPIGGVTSHSELQGRCSACHAVPFQNATMADRCVVCHTDIPKQRDDPSTLHGNLQKFNGSLECRDCHQEHGGSLINATKANVDHAWFGYDLSGHKTKTDGSEFVCKDCHQKDLVNFDAGVCIECHTQKDAGFTQSHIAAFGENCLACHDGIDTYGKNFDHNLFAFGLTGKHANVPCSQCHLNSRTPEDFRTAPTDCNSCHAQDNNHSALLGTDCASCHTTADWQAASFDHNLAAYKLTGKHAEVACADCHVNNTYRGLPTDCFSCHKKDDAHKGQYGNNCALCHTDSGWTPATPFDHNVFSFKLTGRHTNVPCASCHVNNVFKGTPKDCESCHLKISPHNNDLYIHCSYCHSTDYW